MSAWTPNNPSNFGGHWLVKTRIEERGDVVTFYSYKGGTGRSMALVNCAGLIAHYLPSDAKPILLIDFDLEAPGLHRYLTPFLAPADVTIPRPGLLELFETLRKTVDEKLATFSPPASDEKNRLDDEVTASIIDGFDFKPFIVDTMVTGVQLIQAGRFDDTYAERLTRINWEEIFDKAPALFRCLSDRWAREYSFTFVDSRTGLSDTSGICTMLLPNVLIMVFTPNSQSLTGIEHLVRKAVDYRANASDSRELRVYPLPSRVDNQVEHFRHVWRMGDPQHPLFGKVQGYQPMFQEVLGSVLGMDGGDKSVRLTEYFDIVQVPHSADYSYGERLCFTSTSPSDSLSIRASYEQFLPWLTTGAQPWQRPAELLLNQDASLWLRESGVDDVPAGSDGWSTWFERLTNMLKNPQHPVLLQQTLLSPDLRFDTNIVLALAYAYRGEFRASSESLHRAISSYSKDVSSIVPSSAPIQLLELWNKNLSTAELSTPDRKNWIEEIDRLMSIWHPLRNERGAWFDALFELARKVAWHKMERASLEQLVTLKRDGVGEEHPDTLISMNNLAMTIQAQGELAHARELHEKVLAIRRRVLGEEHPDTLASMNNLANTLRSQGELAHARELHEKVLAIRRRVLGEEHPDTLASMNNLANTLRSQGELAHARELHEKVLAIRRRVLGEEHPDTLASMNNLANTLRSQGELAHARELHEKVLAIRRRVLGEEHPDTLASMNDLALTVEEQGDGTGACELQEKVLAISRRVLGEEQPDTLTSMSNLALTLHAQGDLVRARELHEKGLAIRRRVLGEEHPDTLTSMNNLAITLQAQGDLVRARELHEKGLVICRKLLGEEHPDTLTSMNNLANTLRLQDDLLRARELHEKVLAIRRRVLGEEHPDTLTSMNNLALTLQAQGDLVHARELHEKVLAIRQRVLGEEHPDTLASMNNLASTLQEQGDLSTASKLYERVWAGFKRILGDDHPSTWAAGMALGTIAVELDNAPYAAQILDGFASPAVTTDNAQWLGLRLKVAEKLGAKEDVSRYQRRLLDLLKKVQL